MSAAPHEIGASAPALAVVPDPAPAAAPSLAQLLSRRTVAPQGYDQGRPRIVPQVDPEAARQAAARQAAARQAAARQAAARQAAARQAPLQPGGSRGAQAGPMRALREPTFDELVTGYGRHRGPHTRDADVAASPSRAAGPAAAHAGPASPGPRHLEPVKNGEAQLPPSWEQLLTGTHPSFRPPSPAQRGGRGPARHGRGRWRADGESPEGSDNRGPWPENDGMAWGDAVLWTVVAAGAAMRSLPERVVSLRRAALLVPAGCACQPGRNPPRTRRPAVHRSGRSRRTPRVASPTAGHRRDRPEVSSSGPDRARVPAGCTRPTRPPRGRGHCARRRRRTASVSRAQPRPGARRPLDRPSCRSSPRSARIPRLPDACGAQSGGKVAGERHPEWPASRYTQVDPRESLSTA